VITSTTFHLGVDAGNSKTAAAVAGSDGAILGVGREGQGDIYGAKSPQAAVDAVLGAIQTALSEAGIEPGRLTSAAFRLAGIDWPEDNAFWQETIDRHLPGIGGVSILNDGFAAIRCGEPSGVGVAIVSGTAAAVAARGPAGEEWSLSFWLQDNLGAGGLGHAALRAVCLADLGMAPPTALTGKLLAYFGRPDVESLLHFFTGREQPGTWLHHASAAKEVTRAAAEGDAVACQIVEAQCERLAEYAATAAVRVGFDLEGDEIPVVLAGSVLTGTGSPVAERLAEALKARFGTAGPRLAVFPPLVGSVLDALAEADVAITPAVLERLRASVPPAEFLRT
jgi:N-acetylglucosamine kinase-like BadF-type ATPase